MNRRALLKMLPLAPVALLVSPHVGQAEAEPIDTRPTFKLSDYRVRLAGPGPNTCRACGGTHDAYTHGCVPIAWTNNDHFGIEGSWRPAQIGDVPYALVGASGIAPCQTRDTLDDYIGYYGPGGPHQHADFRWVD